MNLSKFFKTCFKCKVNVKTVLFKKLFYFNKKKVLIGYPQFVFNIYFNQNAGNSKKYQVFRIRL